MPQPADCGQIAFFSTSRTSIGILATHWSQQLHTLLKQQNIRQVSFVPDAGHTALIKLCEADDAMRAVRLTTEEEGVALAVGAWLGGDKSVLLMQSSGVGNCINMLSMLSVCQIPLAMLVTMRGDWAEFNPCSPHRNSNAVQS